MAQRISLPAYQRDLTERLRTAEASDAAGSRLGIEAGDDLWLVDLADAGDVLTLPQLERVPLTKPWFAGMVHIRGNLYAVVDFAAFLGAPGVGRTTALCKWLSAEVFRRARLGHVVTAEFDRPNNPGPLPVFCEALGVPVAHYPASTQPAIIV